MTPHQDENGHDDYDPFEVFNRSVGVGLVDNPYPLFAMVRGDHPMLKEDLKGMAGLDGEPGDPNAPTKTICPTSTPRSASTRSSRCCETARRSRRPATPTSWAW